MVLLLITRLFAYKIDQNCYYSLHIVCMQKGPAIMQAIPILLIPPHHMYVRTYSPSRYVSYNKQLKKYEHEQQQQQLQHCDANSKIKIHTHTPLWEKKNLNFKWELAKQEQMQRERAKKREYFYLTRVFKRQQVCELRDFKRLPAFSRVFRHALMFFPSTLSLFARAAHSLRSLFRVYQQRRFQLLHIRRYVLRESWRIHRIGKINHILRYNPKNRRFCLRVKYFRVSTKNLCA